jgi:hypothetical protein
MLSVSLYYLLFIVTDQVIKPQGDWSDLSERLERCFSDIADWMSANMLKLNQEKTELIIFAP